MLDNDKITELEDRIDKFEGILYEIRDALKARGEANNEDFNPQGIESCFSSVVREKIRDIMEDFNFQKVHNVMKTLDWKWAMSKYGVPTIDELKHEAKRLLIEACGEKTCVATGGFRAVYEEGTSEDPDPYVGLELIVEECEGFVDDEDGDDLDAKDED